MSAPVLAPLRWDAERLRHPLERQLPGLRLEIVERCASTNTTLLERARGGDLLPALLVAEEQTAGRGRLGRGWTSARGASLTFSLALPFAPLDWQGLSLAVGVAVAEALDAQHRLAIKWPNDVWLVDDPGPPRRGRKLAGILIETVAAQGQRIAVIGVGVNVLEAVAEQAAGVSGSGVAAWQSMRNDASAPAALAAILPALVTALQSFERHGFAAFEQRFADRDLLRGQSVHTTQPGAADGVAEGVDGRGALLVRNATGVHALTSGEVSVRPAAQPLPGAVGR